MALPVTANLFAHYEADSLGLANGATVTSWTDLSGNGHHLDQTTTTKPTYETNSLNGLGGVLFTGGQELRNFDNNTGDETIYLVIKNPPNNGTDKYINGLYYPYIVKRSTADRFDFGGLILNESGIASTHGIWTWQYRTTNSILRWNLVQKVAADIIPAASDGFELGNSNNNAGETLTGYELIRYTGIHSDGDRDLTEAYLFDKWFVVGDTPIGKEVALRWDDRFALGDPSVLRWDTKTAIGDTTQLVWDVSTVTAIGDQVALAWDVAGPIGDQVALRWDVAMTGGGDPGTGWGIPI